MKLIILLSVLTGTLAVKFNNYFENGMVMQRDVENKVWGYGTLASDEVSVECILKNGKKSFQTLHAKQVDNEVWEFIVPDQTAFTKCNIEVLSEGLRLENVLFGDVWICSGQSNMEQAMSNIDNAEEEIANSAKYGGSIRYSIVKNQVLLEQNDNYDPEIDIVWSTADDSKSLQYMSAICFLYARNVFDVVGVPMGLVSSDWGGTQVEAWSNTQSLESCNVPAHEAPDNPSWTNSALWQGMINPLKRVSITGFLWYQGEANGQYNRDLYNCSFPAMIDSWRREFSQNSETSALAPFGFVQLSTWRPDVLDSGFPVIRWHQTGDIGYVPNDQMTNVFMSSPLDTFDPADGYPGGIHPRYKQIAAERLSIAGLNVVYGLDYPTRGPFPVQIENTPQGWMINYDQDFELREVEISGFYYCAEDPDKCDEGSTVEKWVETKPALQISPRSLLLNLSNFGPIEDLKGSLAYLWRETPVKKLLGLPIYAVDEFQLPSPPWKFKLSPPTRVPK